QLLDQCFVPGVPAVLVYRLRGLVDALPLSTDGAPQLCDAGVGSLAVLLAIPGGVVVDIGLLIPGAIREHLVERGLRHQGVQRLVFGRLAPTERRPRTGEVVYRGGTQRLAVVLPLLLASVHLVERGFRGGLEVRQRRDPPAEQVVVEGRQLV